MSNPLLSLPFEPIVESLGEEYWDVVQAANFPLTKLRFRNDALLKQLTLEPSSIKDIHFEEAYGSFKGRTPLLALRYHGYQFGTYNPLLGDGRGFLYGQLKDRDGKLQDLGTKGSGTTPWSRGGDGRLTLKGGFREIIAGEVLHRLGVNTSRSLSLIETGEELWRGDEPSPTRSSVMVRVARTHLRFGTCERLLYLKKPDLLERLLRHVINIYYPEIAINYPIQEQSRASSLQSQVLTFYAALVDRIAKLAAEWMAAGFVHGVLNTDNMSLVGESFDYGPFAFIEQWDPNFTAAYFDQTNMYAFGRQPIICHHNLHLLQNSLAMIVPRKPMEESLNHFADVYKNHYQFCLYRRLGFSPNLKKLTGSDKYELTKDYELLQRTLDLLTIWPINYGTFFAKITETINKYGLPDEPDSFSLKLFDDAPPPRAQWLAWRDCWWNHQNITKMADSKEQEAIPRRLKRWNISQTPIRSYIEELWSAIDKNDDWEPFQIWLKTII